jgi:hypothetical protein
MSGPDAASEGDSERDGFLSYAAEWHALAIGFYHGVKRLRMPASNPDVEAEPHYYKGAYVLGYILKLVVVIVAGGAGSQLL